MDFRTEAAEATLARVQNSSATALDALADSGCVPVPGGRRVHWLIELPFVAISLICLFAALSALPLTYAGVLPRNWTLPMLVIGLVISLTFRWVKSLIMKMYLVLRAEGFLRLFPGLPAKAVGLEDAATHKKTKLVVEDEGVCLLDAERQRVLLEGCSYRYVVYARDVYAVEPVSGYAMSGARMSCRMAGHDLNMVLMSRGHGPIASLVQTVSPSSGAADLASTLNRTLFGTSETAHRQNALPPKLPNAD